MRAELPHLRAIVQYSGELEVTEPGVMTWAQLMALGRAQADSELDSRLGTIATNQCANLCYTSGTTGNPKVILQRSDNSNVKLSSCQKTFETDLEHDIQLKKVVSGKGPL